MPPLKVTRLAHIQDILNGRKKVLLTKDIPGTVVPQWNELAVKDIYPRVIDELPDLKLYLPALHGKKDPRMPDRDFFYKVLSALYPKKLDKLIDQARVERGPKAINLNEQQWSMAVNEAWMNNLLLYDFESCKCVNSKTSLLFYM